MHSLQGLNQIHSEPEEHKAAREERNGKPIDSYPVAVCAAALASHNKLLLYCPASLRFSFPFAYVTRRRISTEGDGTPRRSPERAPGPGDMGAACRRRCTCYYACEKLIHPCLPSHTSRPVRSRPNRPERYPPGQPAPANRCTLRPPRRLCHPYPPSSAHGQIVQQFQ